MTDEELNALAALWLKPLIDLYRADRAEQRVATLEAALIEKPE